MKMKQKLGAGVLVAIIATSGIYGSVQAANSSTSNSTEKVSVSTAVYKDVSQGDKMKLATSTKVDVSTIAKSKFSTTPKADVSTVAKAKFSTTTKAKVSTVTKAKVTTPVEAKVSTPAKAKVSPVAKAKVSPVAKAKVPTIGANQARVIAVTYLEGKVIKVTLDYDDGILLYEVKLKIAKGTAVVKVDALSGKIISVEKDQGEHKGQLKLENHKNEIDKDKVEDKDKDKDKGHSNH